MSLESDKSDRARKAQLLMLAEKGNADAQYELGMLYKLGDINTSPNLIAAQRWLKKAALQQHSKASAEIKKMATAISFQHSKVGNIKQADLKVPSNKTIPNDQLRQVTNFLKNKNNENQLQKIIPKPNVHTPLSDICRKITDNANENTTTDTESLPPTIRHVQSKIKSSKREKETKTEDIEVKIPSPEMNTSEDIDHKQDYSSYLPEHIQALKFLPSEVIVKLNNLVGLLEVKQEITTLSHDAQDAMTHKRSKVQEFNTLLPNILLCGNPGIGKTTLCNIINELFLNVGLLSTKKPVMVDVTELISLHISEVNRYIDQLYETAANGMIIIEHLHKLYRLDNNKLGHIIFESFVRHNQRYTNDVMIIATCHRHSLSGLNSVYPKMNVLFQKTLQINDLTPSELSEIYQTEIKKINVNITAEALNYVNDLFKTLYRTRGHLFKNAHLVHSSIKQHLSVLANRHNKDKNLSDNLLTIEDVQI